MQIDKSRKSDVVVFGLVTGPVRETLGFDCFKGRFAGVGFAARVMVWGRVAPLEAVAAVEVDARAEAQGGRLPVLAPETIGFPSVDIAVRVQGRDEDPVEGFEHRVDVGEFAVASDEGVGDVEDGAGRDPFAGVGAAGNDDGAAGAGGLFVVGGVDADAEGGNLAAFVGEADAG